MDRFFATLTRQRKMALFGLFFAILIIPITIVFVQKQQEIRSRASGEAATFTLIPQSDTKAVGDTFGIRLILNGGTNNITGLDITLTFNPAIADLTFTPSAIFDQQLINKVISGSFRYAAVNTQRSTITGDAIDVGIISLKAKVAGQTPLTFLKAQVIAEKVAGALPNGTNLPGSYTVTLAPTTTPTPLPTNTPTPTTVPTPTSLPTPTPTLIPTATPTPLPSATPIPSTTPTPLPTSTPVPTSTPTQIPTSTPIPPTPTTVKIAGDVNGDGEIDIRDFNDWRSEFLGLLTTKNADLNGDGEIDIVDFNIWRTGFLKI